MSAIQVIKLAKATNVKRFHTVPIIGEQNIGHHSLRVALILRYVLNGNVSNSLIWATLFHDLAEVTIGDIPSQAKGSSERLSDLLDDWENTWHFDNGTDIFLTEEENMFLSIADKLELVLFCTEQMLLGNKNCIEIRDRGTNYCLDKIGLVTSKFHLNIHNFIEECYCECR